MYFLLYFVLLLVCRVIAEEKSHSIPSHVCVVGAGYSGLATARYLQEYGLNFTVYEATREIGGTWVFNPNIGTDEDGIPVYSNMYTHLRVNTPCQSMAFTGFPFPENTTSFVSGSCFLKYLHSFAKEFDLMKNIQLRSAVNEIKWTSDHWTMTYKDTRTKHNHVVSCDFVVICNGHRYSKPNMPNFRGLEEFQGTAIHSHDYREEHPYLGRKVLIVGAGNAGLDLATYLTNVAERVVHSHHRNFNDTLYPHNYIRKPDIEYFTNDGVIFEDESFEEIDDVIFCTGFVFDHPFLSKSNDIVATSKYVMPLYQHIVNILHPTMTFVGLSKKVSPLMFDKQAEYIAALAAGKFKLPSQADMMASWFNTIHSLETKGKNVTDINDGVDVAISTEQYIADITAEAGTNSPPAVIYKMRKFNQKFRLQDWYHYRDYDYQILDNDHYVIVPSPDNEENCPIHI